MTLASPALRSQWWFANGAKGAGVTERFSIYNPTDDDVEVTPVFLGIAERHRRARRADRRAGPPGRHVRVRRRRRAARRAATPWCSAPTDARSRSSSSGRSPGRSTASRRRRCCSGGLPGPRTAYVATRGRSAIGPGEPTEDALVVYNIDERRRHRHRPGGDAGRRRRRAVAGRASPLPAGGLVTISLTDPPSIDAPARRPLDGAGLRRALAAAWSRRRQGRSRVAGPSRRRRLSRGRGSLAALAAHRRGRVRRASSPSVAAPAPPAAGSADAAGRSRAGRSSTGRLRPARRAVAGRRVHVGDVPHCADVVAQGGVLASDEVAVAEVEYGADRDAPRPLPHRRRADAGDRRPRRRRAPQLRRPGDRHRPVGRRRRPTRRATPCAVGASATI